MNNEQIDNTDYYRLPCGRYLEDFIYYRRLSFADGSALKYMWRAGKKDGESRVKDMAKCVHYVNFIVLNECSSYVRVYDYIEALCKEASEWDGKEAA